MSFYIVQVELEYDDDFSDNTLVDVEADSEDAAWDAGNALFDAPGEHPLWEAYPNAVNISVNAVVDGPFDTPQSDNYVKVDPDEPQRALLEALGIPAETPVVPERYTVQIELDVFTETFHADVEITPEKVAAAAWVDIQDWVANGYRPVVTVIDGDTRTEVDLESE
jgi:hypothetical protein